MGGDGQALANKRSLLESALTYGVHASAVNRGDKAEVKSEDVQQRWQHCALSLEKLETPIAFDLQGDLYSMQSVVDHLQKRLNDAGTVSAPHIYDVGDACQGKTIHKLSDVCQVSNEMCNSATDDTCDIICPITRLLASTGKHSFVGFWGCGHVVAATSLAAEMPRNAATAGNSDDVECVCPVCDMSSILVQLILPSDKAKEQRKRLRHILGMRKRKKRAKTE